MSTVVDDLIKIMSCKDDIKQALVDKGLDMTDVSLEGYAAKISEIGSGGMDYLDFRTKGTYYYSTAERISANTFFDCQSLQSVNLPNCSYVGTAAFEFCHSLQSVNLPNCSYVGNDAFEYCSSLPSIDLPNCSYVDGYAFYSCKSLQSVNLPNCSYVNTYVFAYCSSLQSVNLPNCSYVGSCAFQYCSSLATLTIGTSISTVCMNNNAKIPTTITSIFVPMSLVEEYRTANYWSEYTSLIVGV